MSDDRSRIDVYVNVEDGQVNTTRLNRAIRSLPASVTELSLSEINDPMKETTFSIEGQINGRPTVDVDIPDELYVVGRIVELIHNNTNCRVQETTVDSSDIDRSFTLHGVIKQ